MKIKIRRFFEWLYRLTVEVGDAHYDAIGSYPEQDLYR